MALTIVDGPTIKEGESLSEGVDCSGGQIVRITVPQEYEGGDDDDMTFQVSSDGNMFNDMCDDSGTRIMITARANTSIVIDKTWTRSVGWLKIRSGTPESPVEQREDCKLAIALSSESFAEDAPAGTRKLGW